MRFSILRMMISVALLMALAAVYGAALRSTSVGASSAVEAHLLAFCCTAISVGIGFVLVMALVGIYSLSGEIEKRLRKFFS